MLERKAMSRCHTEEFSYDFLKNAEIIDIHINLSLNETLHPC